MCDFFVYNRSSGLVCSGSCHAVETGDGHGGKRWVPVAKIVWGNGALGVVGLPEWLEPGHYLDHEAHPAIQAINCAGRLPAQEEK